MKTNYASHESQYQWLRKAAQTDGWGTDSEKQEQIIAFDALLASIELPIHGNILELGCGAAELAIHYAQQGYLVSGIDIAPTAIEWGQENAQTAKVILDLQQGDVRQLPYDDASFDLVIDSCLLHCIIGQDRKAVLGEIHRVLKPQGFVIGMTMCAPIRSILHEKFSVVDNCLCQHGIARRYLGKPIHLKEEFASNGFALAEQQILSGFENDTMLYRLVKR